MKNNKKVKINASGYNSSEPIRECPNCGEEKPLSDFGYREMGENREVTVKNNKKVKINASGYNGSEPIRECPNCGEEKPLSDFGYREMGKNREVRNQSWCKKCRSKKK